MKLISCKTMHHQSLYLRRCHHWSGHNKAWSNN